MKTTTQSKFLLLLVALITGLGHATHAGNTWDGGGADNNWGTGNNWNADGAPGYGTLDFSGTTRTNNNNNSITAMNRVNWNGTAPWTMTGSSTLSLFDFGGTQARLESLGSGGVTINAPITFAANNGGPPNPFGEINAVSSDMVFSGSTLTVNGSSCNGIKLWGANTVTFGNTVSASGKWFGFTTTGGAKATISGSFTSGDFYVMNGGTLNLASGGSFTTSGLRLGGDFGNTGNQDQTKGGTFNLTSSTGGQTFSGTVNPVSGNSSGNLVIHSANTSGTNTLSGGFFLDNNLRVTNAAGGTLVLSGATLDLKNQTLTVAGAGNTTISGTLQQSIGSGKLTKTGAGTLTLTAANSYSGATTISEGTLLVNGSTAAGSAVSIASGATIGGTGTINGTVTVNSGGTLAPGTSIGTLTNAASPTLAGTTLMEINAASSPNADKLVRSGGSLAFGGALIVTNIGGAPVSGDTFDLFDATSFSGFFTSTNLPPGGAAHWLTSQLGVNGTITFTNNNPAAGTQTFGVAQREAITIPISNGDKSLASDADGDTVTVTALGTTNAVDFGVAIISGGGTSITYTNTSGGAGSIEHFSYTVSDGVGGLATNSLTIHIDPAQGANLVSATAGGGFAYLHYAGIPGTNYALDWATNIAYPVNWTQVQTKVAEADGALRYTNLLSSYPTNDFFRTRYVP